MIQVSQTISKKFDELRDLNIELQFPSITSKRRLFFENSGGMRRKQKDEFLNLAVFLHLAFEAIDRKLPIELGY